MRPKNQVELNLFRPPKPAEPPEQPRQARREGVGDIRSAVILQFRNAAPHVVMARPTIYHRAVTEKMVSRSRRQRESWVS
jgi:hypothetical protein